MINREKPDNLSLHQRLKWSAGFVSFWKSGLLSVVVHAHVLKQLVWLIVRGMCLDISLCAGEPSFAPRGTFLRFRRLRKTSVPSLWDLFISCLALQTALAANPLDWGYSGLLYVKSHFVTKSLKRWLVNCPHCLIWVYVVLHALKSVSYVFQWLLLMWDHKAGLSHTSLSKSPPEPSTVCYASRPRQVWDWMHL